MKKSLVKKLVRMAKDGDPEAIEAVAELLEEVSEAEVIETVAPAAEPEAEEVAEAVGDPEVVVETPAGNVVAIDEESFAGILERLDQIISLLTPAAQDEDPVEEIVEAVAEAVAEGEEATTAGGGNLVGSEVNRNEQASQWEAATIEVAGMAEGTTPEEISEIVEEILDPVLSETLEEEPAGDECGEPEEASATDALRAALNAIRPALVRMPKKQRRKVAADIAARMQKRTGRKASDGSTYAALAAAARRKAAAGPDLGKMIMAKRNPNYKK